jgi:hypothetical protein
MSIPRISDATNARGKMRCGNGSFASPFVRIKGHTVKYDFVSSHQSSAYDLEEKWGLDEYEYSSLPFVHGGEYEHRKGMLYDRNKLYLYNHVDPVIRKHYKFEEKMSLYRKKELRSAIRETPQAKEAKREERREAKEIRKFGLPYGFQD